MDSNHPFSILVVDDTPVNVKLLETTLTKEGYRVIAAADGPAARKAALEERPDLILLDIRMPGEDGFEVIKALKNNAATSAIPVIFLTGVSEIDAKLSGFELGAVDYITKPFHPREVLARVRLHLKLSIATNSMIAAQAERLKQITEAQVSMLTTPAMQPKANFGVYYHTLEEAGGDFYDVLAVTPDIFGYFLADFSGHDIKTSYLTASIKALLKQNASPIYQPLESIKMINDVLVEILPEGKYLTACYARLNRKAGQLVLINAGHPPMVYIPKNGEAEFIKLEGDILGIFKDVCLGQRQLAVASGDRFFLYSDGLTESLQHRNVWAKKLDDILFACNEVRGASIEEAPRRIVGMLRPEDNRAEDDLVVLGVEI
ncbi:MAG: SpoIIE family protein phosphatase [Thermodesulfobacteriota bacterium]